MANVRIADIELINTLNGLGKAYFTVGDLEKIIKLERNSLLVILSRLVKKGILRRVRRNIYTVFSGYDDVNKIAGEIYYPSYISFETALSDYGILSQIPYTVTLATTKRSKKMMIGHTEVEYSHLANKLFFGYKLKNGKYTAEPEKALLDQLYLMSRGLRNINIEELDLKNIDERKFNEYARKFPKYIGRLVNDVKKYIGSTPITNENKERITI